MTLRPATKPREVHAVRTGALHLPDGSAIAITASTSPVLIGRDSGCAVVLDDSEVSAAHAEIVAEPEGVLLRDLGSKNGTIVGGARLREGILVAACSIQIGGTLLRFEPRSREAIQLLSDERLGGLWGRSPRMRQLFKQVREVAPTDLSVLITGETGTGKELVARALHEQSRRAKGPLVVLDCASIPPTLAESELFGHEKGAFTHAVSRTRGAFHEADGGTLFLDEIGELPMDLQPKLLRVLAEKKIKRVGTTAYESVDVRLVAATLRDLGRGTNTGKFRADLFFRIAQVRLELAPLRERRGDIPPIVEATCERIGKPERSAELVDLVTGTFAQHDWPGNVRELVSFVTVAAELPPGSETLATMYPFATEAGAEPITSEFGRTRREAMSAFEKDYFLKLVAATGGNISEIARRSGLERHHVRRHLRKYGIDAR